MNETNRQNRRLRRDLDLARGICTVLACAVFALVTICILKIREQTVARTYWSNALTRAGVAEGRVKKLETELAQQRENVDPRLQAYERAYQADHGVGAEPPGMPTLSALTIPNLPEHDSALSTLEDTREAPQPLAGTEADPVVVVRDGSKP